MMGHIFPADVQLFFSEETPASKLTMILESCIIVKDGIHFLTFLDL